ncbi:MULTISPECIES: hypothetical protein [unclassified Sphingomonas]|jgi:cobalamin biosynthesis Mg chelatase CobN|uniref:hypothetical protein n=1 Tax=unclassified Sphingomonas TaxID=196159 RepID=UPI0007019575|nr:MULTISPECIES: hypothetical protein [unclassified Sphingomonas]KQM26454.1 hypothetical protein ASE58_12085 [Sphingomonas sp. Leaf9]KQM42863.1 hypothetical protein ASE57_12090 [Sphingomonas sp. Leaf11]KQM87151.1 hypothetical protein ASE67_05275 [Sphingomonas sp. Leaf23]
MTAGGWQARALSWVLAIFATLAMVGAVATMSTKGGSSRSGAEVGTDAAGRVDPRTGAPLPPPAPFTTGAPRVETAESAAMAQQAAATRSVSDGLAVLTYAVLALVAVLAVGVLALFRIAQALQDRRD